MLCAVIWESKTSTFGWNSCWMTDGHISIAQMIVGAYTHHPSLPAVYISCRHYSLSAVCKCFSSHVSRGCQQFAGSISKYDTSMLECTGICRKIMPIQVCVNHQERQSNPLDVESSRRKVWLCRNCPQVEELVVSGDLHMNFWRSFESPLKTGEINESASPDTSRAKLWIFDHDIPPL